MTIDYRFVVTVPAGSLICLICFVLFDTSRAEPETELLGAQVPLNEIKVAIARWKEEKQTS
jgi:hypothetical protein